MDLKDALCTTRDLWSGLKRKTHLHEMSLMDVKRHVLAEIGGDKGMKNACPMCEYVERNHGVEAGREYYPNLDVDVFECVEHCPLRGIWPEGCEFEGPYGAALYHWRDDQSDLFISAADAIIAECERVYSEKFGGDEDYIVGDREEITYVCFGCDTELFTAYGDPGKGCALYCEQCYAAVKKEQYKLMDNLGDCVESRDMEKQRVEALEKEIVELRKTISKLQTYLEHG